MKKIVSSMLVAFALIGSVAAVSAAPYHDNIVNDRLEFWQNFADRGSD